MDVIHLSCQPDGRFYLWAERSDLPPKVEADSNETSEPPDHPFAADVWALWDVFEETAPGWLIGHGSDRTATLILPSSDRGPAASPALMREDSDIDEWEAARPRPWRVPALTLPGEATVEWLREEWREMRGVTFGREWPVWRRCARLAVDLVDAGQLVPTLERGARVRLRDHDYTSTFDDPTPQEAWLSALVDRDPTVRTGDEQIDRLHRQLDDWTRDLRDTQQRRVRLHFRLHPPAIPEDSGEMVPVDTPWRLEFLLQSIQEPSLVVEAETVWESTDRARELLDTRLDRPRERLLEELGRARTIFPPLERALEAREPTALELQTDEAFQFLEDHADLLDQAGFSIQIPDWWDKPGHRLSARLRGGGSGSGDLGLETVCRFDWEVALGDETLDREQLEQLAKLKQPLVRHRGEWVTLDSDDIDAALELLENTSGEMEAGEALRTRLGLEETDLPVTDADFDGWLGELFETAKDERFESPPTPENFEGDLRPYQSRGLGWIRYLEQLGLGGCLADD